ncbi:hypothetical protein NQ317_010601 [Molorchus minor]|uniref:FAM193 C-terminal domain-containing protein n=1 Tax=Molorchus minor TaxID=1323400 RepID=A0ABQ9JRQ9_9CUCU|nr:hypothetical protein NQ317_010601 [Molorchus minor]
MENEVNKLREIRKNGHKPYPVTCKPATLVPKARCEHSCKHEVEAKPNICPGHTCDHHKESKKCECTYCEVFGTSVTSHSHKTNELRDKLRIRLHQRREKRTKDICKAPITAANANNPNRIKSTVNKVEERVPLPSSPTNIPPAPSVKLADSSTMTSSTPHDIHGLLSYIEGHSVLNQLELAEKKAAKKARQRMKKEEERIKFEEEQRKLAEAIKRKEEEKKREIARLLAEKERAKALSEEANQEEGEEGKASSEKTTLAQKPVCEERPAERGEVMEQTIPAMGSTPDQDKLLHTLVKDSDNGNSENQNLNSTGAKKKKKKKQYNRLEPTVIAKELKVTLAVDSNRVNTQSKMMNKNIDEEIQAVETNEFKIEPTSHEDLDIPMLRLPPGITITKVAGPVINRKYEVGSLDDQKGTPISVAKSGVIVVDTEKLIQNNKHHHIDLTQKATKSSKRNKKKKNQKEAPATTPTVPNVKRMITLKNPLFQTFHPRPDNPLLEKNVDGCSPATIITNENGMVTIRSSRLQHSLSNNTGLAPVPSVPLPNLIPEMTKIKKTNTFMPAQSISDDKDDISPLNAQEILSGLPGIEITKVDKKAIKSNAESNKFCQTAQVSIIPTANGGDKFNFDKDDWLYDSVFTPRDVLEDDMDAEELELEAFKRFCQQSVPPKRKEKVAHLNVADIVFKKKTDINYF